MKQVKFCRVIYFLMFISILREEKTNKELHNRITRMNSKFCKKKVYYSCIQCGQYIIITMYVKNYEQKKPNV